MDNFNYTKKETYTQEELNELLGQHTGYVTSNVKKEQEIKLKEAEAKLNALEEKQLFSNIKNEKQKDVIKSLMYTEKYKNLSKQEAFKQVTEDYKDIFNLENKENNNNNLDQSNPDVITSILELHEKTDNPNKIDELEKKAKTKGLSDKKELETYISAVKADALKNTK